MREKEKKGMQHKDWGRESPRVRHICLALDIKNNENRTDVSYGRGRRLSRGEITNRSVCPLFVLNLFILFERKKCEHHVAAYKTEKKKKKYKHSFRWLHNMSLLQWRCWRWTLKGKTQYCSSTLKFAARCSNWQTCLAFGHPEGERDTQRDSERAGEKREGRKRETLCCKESCDRAKVTSQCNY